MAKRMLALVLVVVLLSGCIYRSEGENSLSIGVYRLGNAENGGALLVEETVSYQSGEDVLQVLLAALNSQPGLPGMEKVFPEGVEALNCRIEDGTATIELSTEYLLLGDMKKLLCDSAVTLSYSALNEVCAVDIECGGRIVTAGMTPEDIQQGDALFQPYERTLKLFLPTQDRRGLAPQSVELVVDGKRAMEVLVAEQVLRMLPSPSAGVVVLSAQTVDGVCTVDLSEAFYGNEPADYGAAMLIIYSLVNSLCRLGNVDSVLLSVEGQPVRSYGGYRPSWPLTANEDMIIY